MADDADRLRAYESEHGYVRAALTLVATSDGGRRGPIASGYRSCWDVSSTDGRLLLTDAPLLIEGRDWLQPGESATVRLHPLFRENWTGIGPGKTLGMFEGPRRVGVAAILDIALR
jgi:hypothetical protein